MWRLIYQIGIQLLFIYFKIASAIGDKKAIEGSIGRKKWKVELKKLNKGLTTYWIHAASHGEGLMAVPLIKKLLKSENHQVIISFFSPSGYKNFNYTNSKLIKTYIPLDSRKNAREIVRIINPKHLMFVKYDLWLNIIDECQKNKIPVSVFSCKFNSNQWYFKFYGGWAKIKLLRLSNIFTNDIQSTSFLTSKGFKNVITCGDTRYDQVDTSDVKSEIRVNHPCLIVGSSWQKEEEIALELFNNLNGINLIIAPHEINKNRIDQLKIKFGNDCKLYSEIDKDKNLPKVTIINQIGLLADLYSISDFALIGGGFKGKLHNIIEPAAKGNIILFGPNHSKFPEAQNMINEKIAYQIVTYQDIVNIIQNSDQLISIKKKSIDFVLKNKGATDLIYEKVKSTQ